ELEFVPSLNLGRVVVQDAVESIESGAVLCLELHIAVESEIVQTWPLVHVERIGQPEGAVVAHSRIAGDDVHPRASGGQQQFIGKSRREGVYMRERHALVRLK